MKQLSSPRSPRSPRTTSFRATPAAWAGVVFAVAALVTACCKNNPPAATVSSEAKAATDPKAEPPARPASKASCDACKGQWGKHGLGEVESCICRTKDGGKVCRDGADCEGECIAPENGFRVTEKGPPPKGHWEGKCSEFDTTFGCHKRIQHGARAKGAQIEDEGVDNLCVD